MRTTGALLAAAALLLSACGGTGSAEDAPAPTPSGLATACPDPSMPLRFPEGDLPSGASTVRLCAGEAHGTTGRLVAPADALTTSVDAVVEAVNSLEPVAEDQACTLEGGFDLVYWFGYPDGDWRAVRLGAYGCRVVQVGADLARVDGMPVAQAFVDGLLAQRAAAAPPDDAHEATCASLGGDASWSPLPAAPAQLRTAVLCSYPRRFHTRARQVPADLMAQLNAGLLAGPAVAECPQPEVMTLEGWTTWGDPQVYYVDSCGRVTASRGAGTTRAGETEEVFGIDPALLDELLALPQGPLVDTREE